MDSFDMCRKEFFPIQNVEKGCNHHFLQDDGVFICCHCNLIEVGLVNGYTPYYQRNRSPSAPYKRANHWRNRLNELQGINSVLIPEELMKLCKAARSVNDVKTILQKKRLKSYYPLIYTIYRQLGNEVPVFSHSELKRLSGLFDQICLQYKKNKNMVSYHFLLRKLSEFIGRHDIIPFLFILKDKRKLVQYERDFSQLSLE